MPQPTNTFDRYDQVGVREDLQDMIFDISPEETPVISSLSRKKAENTYHEWQTDVLRAANPANAAIEGDVATASARGATSRVGNHTQIFQDTVVVSGTARVVNTAGRKDELAYQLAKVGKELKRDMEAAATQNAAANAGTSSVARRMASLETMIVTNISSGVGGSTAAWTTGAATTAPTDGTQRAFTETLLRTVIATGVQNGMRTKMLCLGVGQKQVFSSFAGIAVNRFQLSKPEQGTIIGAADVYVSDFGQLVTTVDLFQRNRTALLIDPEYAELAVLRPMKKTELAKDGDYDKYQMLTELTLVVKNERAHAKVADLT